jgi:hypothetical protein
MYDTHKNRDHYQGLWAWKPDRVSHGIWGTTETHDRTFGPPVRVHEDWYGESPRSSEAGSSRRRDVGHRLMVRDSPSSREDPGLLFVPGWHPETLPLPNQMLIYVHERRDDLISCRLVRKVPIFHQCHSWIVEKFLIIRPHPGLTRF